MKNTITILIIVLTLLFLFVFINLHISLKTSKLLTGTIETYDIEIQQY